MIMFYGIPIVHTHCTYPLYVHMFACQWQVISSVQARPCRLKEQLEDVDEKLQLRRKARNTLLDVRRQLPQVSVTSLALRSLHISNSF